MSSAAAVRAVTGRAHRPARWWWDRGILLGGVATATVLAWLHVMRSEAPMHANAPFTVRLAMWSIMMLGMMLPAASPMIVTYAAVSSRSGGHYLLRTGVFVLAYLDVWCAVSALGALAQTGLRTAALLSHQGALTNPLLAGAVLMGAGVYQLTPLKHACLRRCRTPLGFLLTEWRPGKRGAFVLGARHGIECVLCCWAVMALMFVLGTMNLVGMAALTVLMLAEKVAPGGHHIGRAAAVLFLTWGGWLVLGGGV